jgi:hypothetical protein
MSAVVTLHHCHRGHGATQWWQGASPWASPRRSCRTPLGARLHLFVHHAWTQSSAHIDLLAMVGHHGANIGAKRRGNERMSYWWHNNNTRTRRVAASIAHGCCVLLPWFPQARTMERSRWPGKSCYSFVGCLSPVVLLLQVWSAQVQLTSIYRVRELGRLGKRTIWTASQPNKQRPESAHGNSWPPWEANPEAAWKRDGAWTRSRIKRLRALILFNARGKDTREQSH